MANVFLLLPGISILKTHNAIKLSFEYQKATSRPSIVVNLILPEVYVSPQNMCFFMKFSQSVILNTLCQRCNRNFLK